MGCIINKGVGKGGKGIPRKKSRKMIYDVGVNDFDSAVKVDGIVFFIHYMLFYWEYDS